MSKIKEQLQKLITESKIKLALTRTLKILEAKGNTSLANEARLLLSKFNKLKAEERTGTIRADDADVASSKIIKSLLFLVDNIDTSPEENRAITGKNSLWIIVVLVLVSSISVFFLSDNPPADTIAIEPINPIDTSKEVSTIPEKEIEVSTPPPPTVNPKKKNEIIKKTDNSEKEPQSPNTTVETLPKKEKPEMQLFSNDLGLSGVTVTFTNDKGDFYKAISDADGMLEIKLPKSWYRKAVMIDFQKKGYKSQNKRISLTNQTIRLPNGFEPKRN